MKKSLCSMVLIAASLLCFGCKEEVDEPENCNWHVETADEEQAVSDTGSEWYYDANNTSKCNAYRNALQVYVDALEASEHCAILAGQHSDWRGIIQSAQRQINDLQC